MKREYFEAWLKREREIVKIDTDGFAWAGFWIGLGLVIAAAIDKGQVVLR